MPNICSILTPFSVPSSTNVNPVRRPSVPRPLRSLCRSNVSSRELDKLERGINKGGKIRRGDFKRLKQTLSHTENYEKGKRISRLLNKTGHSQLDSNVSSIKESKPIIHPPKMSDFEQGVTNGRYNIHQGCNRLTYIDKETGQGYKFLKPDGHFFGDLTSLAADLRLNDIYKSSSFYGGKYAHLASNEIIVIIDDRVGGAPMMVPTFKVMHDAVPLSKDEKIPYSVVRMLEDMGYQHIDIKPDNFMKIRNESGKYDYLPIDAKCIALDRSLSMRSSRLQAIINANDPNLWQGQFIDHMK